MKGLDISKVKEINHRIEQGALTDEDREYMQKVSSVIAKVVEKVFNRIKEMLISFVKSISKSSDEKKIEYIKQFEKRELYPHIKTAFESPIVQKRYDDIVIALKYTKHSKKRERLLKLKRMYEKHLGMEG